MPQETEACALLVELPGGPAVALPAVLVEDRRALALVVSVVALAVAAVGAAAGLGSLGLYEADLVNADTAASLGVASILCALIGTPIGVLGWRWAEKRSEKSILGQAAGLVGGGTLAAWILALVYALSQDTP